MTGWECPKCGACFAPHIDRCPDCAGTVQGTSVNVPSIHVDIPGGMTTGFCTCVGGSNSVNGICLQCHKPIAATPYWTPRWQDAPTYYPLPQLWTRFTTTLGHVTTPN